MTEATTATTSARAGAPRAHTIPPMRTLRSLMLLVGLASCGSFFSPTPTPRRDAGADVTAAASVCDEASFDDRRDGGAERVITFGGALGMAYAPRCLTVAPGQSVRFVGSLTTHPLRAGRVGVAGSGAGSPITDTSAGDEVSFTFPAAGEFPFHCGVHGAMGMTGAVRVR